MSPFEQAAESERGEPRDHGEARGRTPEDNDHRPPTLGGPDEDSIIRERLAQLDRAPHLDGPSFLAALVARAETSANER
jgi:hypothetical protein